MFPVQFSRSATIGRSPATGVRGRPAAAILLLIIAGVSLAGCAIKMPSFGGFATGSNAAKPAARPDQERPDQDRYAMGVAPAAYGTPGTAHRRNAQRRSNPGRAGAEAGAAVPSWGNNDQRYLDRRSAAPVRTLRPERSRQYGQPRLFERSRDQLASGGPFADPNARYRPLAAPLPRQRQIAGQSRAQFGDQQYEVRPGDTIYGIARNAGISAQALINANRLADPSRLQVGMILTLPR